MSGLRFTLLTGALLAIAACGGASSPTTPTAAPATPSGAATAQPTPTAATTTSITLSGDVTGTLTLVSGSPQCATASTGQMISLQGTLPDGKLYELRIAPNQGDQLAGPVSLDRRGGTASAPAPGYDAVWGANDNSGVSNLDVSRGATLNADLQPMSSLGPNATQVVHVAGTIVCP